MSVAPFTLTTQLARSPLPVTGARQIVQTLIALRANATTLPASLPLNLSLVVDHSILMRGVRLQHLKAALAQIIDQLSPEDTLSIIAFDDLVQLVAPAQPVDDPDHLKAAVEMIEVGGGTALGLGLGLGLAEAKKDAGPDRASRIIVVMDGHTDGDEDHCRALAAEAGELGIPLTLLGYGAEWRDDFLAELAALSGGPPPVYVRAPADLLPCCATIVQAARGVALQRLTLNMRFVDGVTPRRITQVTPYLRNVAVGAEDRAVTLALGDLDRDFPLMALVEVAVEPKRGGTFRIAQIEASARDFADDPVKSDVVVAFSASANKPSQTQPIVVHYVERVNAAQVVLRALEGGEGAAPPYFAPNLLDLFDAESREALQTLASGAPLTREARKALRAKTHDLTQVRRG